MTLIRNPEMYDEPDYRYRVFEVFAVLGDNTVSARHLREFKTIEAADRYEASLREAGKRTLMQTGIVKWMSQDELGAHLAAITQEPVDRQTERTDCECCMSRCTCTNAEAHHEGCDVRDFLAQLR